MPHDEAVAARKLMSARAVRERTREMLRLCEADQLSHWRLDRTRLPEVADFTLHVMRENYPDLKIPFHARWRHFSVAGADRSSAIFSHAKWRDAAARGRAEFDLAIVSVLLDAGAGSAWRYADAVGNVLARSEGLAIASLDMFASGLFSSHPDDPLRADASRLAAITEPELGAAFQCAPSNRIVGLPGRVALLNALGRACLAAPDVFGREDSARPGGLFDLLACPALAAEDILAALLAHLGPVWPSRLTLGGVPLGDTWRHPGIRAKDASDGFVPFHKLSQWLSYSLIEPLQRAGVEVTDIDGLTGLPEYRNGGLFVDFCALVPKRPDEVRMAQTVDSMFIVEWRALTVALLDEIADAIRAKLGLDPKRLPLACVLEGGTWAAGRRVATQKRADGSPPLNIVSDGTVF
jgi:hypothetical protein